MQKKPKPIFSIDDYVRSFPRPVQKQLREMRSLIREQAPDAEEKISYRMPAFDLNGPLVYFAAYEHHIGFYPTASGIRAFRRDLSKFKNSKGAVQFPLGEPLPKTLIRRIVQFRVAENRKKTKK